LDIQRSQAEGPTWADTPPSLIGDESGFGGAAKVGMMSRAANGKKRQQPSVAQTRSAKIQDFFRPSEPVFSDFVTHEPNAIHWVELRKTLGEM
jgi:hypothetical protein